jgi:DNA-binding MarR family transcriptional regulator
MPSRTTSQPAEVAAFASALDDFRRASGRAKGRLAADGDLTLSQYHLLEPLLAAAEPLGVGELACAAGVSAPTATRMLAGLERDAFVERHACTRDRRVVRVVLTPEGEDRMTRKRDRMQARHEELFRSLEPGERAQAARLLHRLAAAIEELR